MLLMTSSRISSIMAEKKKMDDFLHFMPIIYPCGCNNFTLNNSGRLLCLYDHDDTVDLVIIARF